MIFSKCFRKFSLLLCTFHLFINFKTMDFKIGDKIQAIDEVGRWEMGKILDVVDGPEAEETEFLVTFLGWSQQYNRRLKPPEIRKPVIIGMFLDLRITQYTIPGVAWQQINRYTHPKAVGVRGYDSIAELIRDAG